MKRALIAVLLSAAVGLAGGAEFLNIRGNLRNHRSAINAQWKQLSAAFDRRAELIAHLAPMIQASGGPDDPAFADVAAARTALTQAETPQAKIEANGRLMNAFARLYLAAEAHPKLTGSGPYRRLNEEIGNAESAVAVERRKYNDLLEHYNAQLQRFPSNVVAEVCGWTRNDAYVRTEQEVQ